MSQLVEPVPQNSTDDSELESLFAGVPQDDVLPTDAEDWVIGDPARGQIISMLIAVTLPFLCCVGGVVAMWMYGWMGPLYLTTMILGWFMAGLGVTIGFHRLLSHRSFETYNWVRGFWMALGAMSIQGSPLVWVSVHRRHHQHSDRHGDPHSPHMHDGGWWNCTKGFVHSHFGWLFTGHWSHPEQNRYIPDLLGDRLLMGIDRMYHFWLLLSLGLPALICGLITMSWMGAFLGFFWGGVVRTFMAHHLTWSINSICHIFGSREFESGDSSRNNVLFGMIAHGEGWHNNHHAFPTSARHGLRWWQFDLSWIIIRTMQMLGLAWNVKVPSKRAIESRRIQTT